MSGRTIWKFPLSVDTPIYVTGGEPRIIHVGPDPATTNGPNSFLPTVWAELDPDAHDPDCTAVIFVGTGHDVPHGWDHAGSCILGPYVWHVYTQQVNW